MTGSISFNELTKEQELLQKLTTLTKRCFAKGQEEVDITAVFKYIEFKNSKEQDSYNESIGKEKEYWEKVETVVGINQKCFRIGLCKDIPSKPLTLYTLQELESLYKLIKELGA